jgi:hypothetical protein
MKDWDEEKLRSVVTQQESKQKTSTDVSVPIPGWDEADIKDRVQVLHSGCRGAEVWLVVSLFRILREFLLTCQLGMCKLLYLVV